MTVCHIKIMKVEIHFLAAFFCNSIGQTVLRNNEYMQIQDLALTQGAVNVKNSKRKVHYFCFQFHYVLGQIALFSKLFLFIVLLG